jgi:hypothetical protein
MGTKVRPEVSEKNKYWIEKHRYYELKHFCLQYPAWKQARAALGDLTVRPPALAAFSETNVVSDPTARIAEARLFYSDRMEMIGRAALAADEKLGIYILRAVTKGYSYEYLKTKLEIPCGREKYYELYRRFFWLLNKERQ